MQNDIHNLVKLGGKRKEKKINTIVECCKLIPYFTTAVNNCNHFKFVLRYTGIGILKLLAYVLTL